MKGESLRSNEGVALVLALIMLLILTLIGISAISTTTLETSITGNERAGTDAFYASEAIFQLALRQLDAPDSALKVRAIPRTKIGEDSWGWTGSPEDKASPKGVLSFGFFPKAGYDSSWAFNRYQINATGESLGAMKEVEAQVSYGPFPAGTQY